MAPWMSARYTRHARRSSACGRCCDCCDPSSVRSASPARMPPCAMFAARLAGARDSEVMQQTLEGLIERHPHRLGDRPGVRRLLAHLAAEHRRASRQALAESAGRTVVIAELQAFRWRANGRRCPRPTRSDLLEPGLRRMYAQGRTRYRRAAHGKGNRTRAMHEWRKTRQGPAVCDRAAAAARAAAEAGTSVAARGPLPAVPESRPRPAAADRAPGRRAGGTARPGA